MPANTQANRRQTFVDDVGPAIAANDPRDFFIYNVIAANNRGRSAGPSNPVTAFLAPSVRPANDVRANVQPDTVVLTWTPQSTPSTRLNAQFAQRVYRTGDKAEPQLLATLSTTDSTYKDTTFAWEKPYTYTVVAVTKVLSRDGSKTLDEFEGESSAPLTITPHDIFPPAAPQAVQAVYSTGFIDLAWHPNTEGDIAGYNVYRGNQKLNAQPVTASAFRDDKLQGIAPGAEVVYYVTAIDTQGNESPRSEPATERIPKP
jgi:fibronectin type 3 domain-containing protein